MEFNPLVTGSKAPVPGCFCAAVNLPSADCIQLRRSDIFVESQTAENSKLRRSGIVCVAEYVAPTELVNLFTTLTTTIPLLRSLNMTRPTGVARN